MLKTVVSLLVLLTLAILTGKVVASLVNAQDRVIKGDYRSLVDAKPVLYIAEQCPACDEALNFILKNNLDFEVRSSGSYPNWIQDMSKLASNQVPLLVYPDRVVIGFTAEQYTER